MLQNCTKNLADVSKVLQPGQLRSERKGSIYTFVGFFLFLSLLFFFFKETREVVLFEKGRGKIVKCLKIYSFLELFPNPKQGTMMHAS